MKILLLEDEYPLRISIEEFLNDLEYRVDSFGTSDEAFDAIFSNQYDLLLLDVKVPGKTGFELLKELRKEGVSVPAIFITSMTMTDDMAKGYESGCCDYIKKPFDLLELQLRIQQALKQYYYRDKEELIRLSDGYTYDTKNFCLMQGDEKVQLSKTEKEIVDLLVKNLGSVVSIETFQDVVWGEYVDPANIRVQINKLRKKVHENFIKNIRGIGYVIEA
jgi:DNA-binding response OmpR family regulator